MERVKLPEGRIGRFEVPEGTTPEQVMEFVQKDMAKPETSFLEDAAGYVNKGVQSVASGVTGGFMDEAAARLDSPFVAGYRSIVEGQPFDMDKAYGDRLKGYRQDQKEFREDHPVSALATEVGGAVVSPITKATFPLMIAKQGTKLLPRMGRAATVGAGIGAVYGAGNADTDPSSATPDMRSLWDRLIGAGTGAGIGFATGGAAVPVVDVAAKGVRAVIQPILNRFGKTEAGYRKAVEAVARGNGGDVRAAIETVRQALAAGEDLAIADVGGINVQRMARAAANVPGKSTQIADDFVAQRAAGRGQRMQSAADELAPNRFYDNLDELSAAQRQSAKPLYDEAFAPRSDPSGRVYAPWDDRLQQFLDDSIVQQGMGKGIRIQQLEALAEGRPFNFQEFAVKGFDDAGKLIIEGTPNLRAMDAAKRGIDEILEGYRDPTSGRLVLDEYGRAVEQVRKALVKKLDDITTDQSGRSAYVEARKAWAGPASIKDAQWRGRRFMRGDEEMTRKAFESMTEAQQNAFQLGVRRELSKTINADTQAAPGRFADKKADLWGRLEAIFPPERFAAFREKIGQEQAKMQTERMVSPRAGSHTAPMKEDIAELSRMPSVLMESMEGAARGRGAVRSAIGAVAPFVRAPIQAMTRPNERTATQLADILLTMDKGKQSAFLDSAVARRYAEDLLPVLKGPQRTRLTNLLLRGGAAEGASR